MATINFDCEVPCKIVVNERRLSETTNTFFLGVYRVWVKASAADQPWEYHEVVLDTAGAAKTIVYEDPTPSPSVDPIATPSPLTPVDRPKNKRVLPRAAEIAGIVAGAGLLAAGAVLLTYDGKCSNTNEPYAQAADEDECGKIYESTISGFSLIGIGGGLLFVSGVLLSVDVVRVGRTRGHQALVGVSLKF